MENIEKFNLACGNEENLKSKRCIGNMKSIKLLLDKTWAMNFFKKRASRYFPGLELLDCKINIMKVYVDYHSHRLTVNYHLKLRDKKGGLVEKVIVGKSEKRKTSAFVIDKQNGIFIDYLVTKYLAEHGLKTMVPEAIDYIPALNLYLYRYVPGYFLQELSVKHQGNKFLNKIKPAVQILKKIHNFKSISDGSKFLKTQNRETKQCQDYLRLMHRYYNPGYSNLLFFVKKCHKFRSQYNQYFGSKFYRLIHGDFYSRNIIINQNRVRTIDFSDSKFYEPLNDIGNFLINTELMFEYDFHRTYRALMKKVKEVFCRHYFTRPISETEKAKIDYFILTNLIRITAFAAMNEANQGLANKPSVVIKKLLKIGQEKCKYLK
jgi:thiamine kinase-like enzyme